MQSILKNEIKFIFFELVGDAFRFPTWWYTAGLKKIAKGRIKSVKNMEDRWALGVWVKNIFVPMFGEYDWAGRIISFFMRCFQIFVRFIIVAIWALISFIFLLFWIIFPVFIVSQIIYHWTSFLNF